MNKNIEDYKKAINQIHVDESLKEKVLDETKEKNKSRKPIYYFSYAMSVAVIVIVAVVGLKMNFNSKNYLDVKQEKDEIIEENLDNVNIKRFSSNQELRNYLNEYLSKQEVFNGENGFLPETTLADSIVKDYDKNSSLGKNETTQEEASYSKTNNQVDGVDEADIVKTDGKYIYYCENSNVYIMDNDLNLKSIIKDENISPRQIFINGDKLIVLGFRQTTNTKDNVIEDESTVRNIVFYASQTFANVYSLKDIEEPKLQREIIVDGSYREARMIDNNVYFVSSKDINLYREFEDLEDEDILPHYNDTCISAEEQIIDAKNIAYFDETPQEDCVYTMIAGFNLDSEEDVNIETFLGCTYEVYVSKNNMYIVTNNYSGEASFIYKFALKDGKIVALANSKVEGIVNNQFSLDEYNGNLRIATTVYEYKESAINTVISNDYTTRLTIFNENLEKIGEIENLIENEKIYSVRFIGNVGYIVTFETVDPLWVIDLSDPKNPIVKGELEIPGYSSYLHPWDENHIIGIGYDVKDNGYGGVTNDKIKLSMFDISDLENPKEIFKINLEEAGYSSVLYDHKALFVNKERNMIGLPITIWKKGNDMSGVLLYKVDLENNKFEEISNLVTDGYNNLERSIYIGDYIYNLFYNKVIKYDFNTFEEVKRLEFDLDYTNMVME